MQSFYLRPDQRYKRRIRGSDERVAGDRQVSPVRGPENAHCSGGSDEVVVLDRNVLASGSAAWLTSELGIVRIQTSRNAVGEVLINSKPRDRRPCALRSHQQVALRTVARARAVIESNIAFQLVAIDVYVAP